ncbi:MAG: hypothetical protein RID53_02640 [Coleofasciculus sp. B1-GNL1-01]|uniref:hypothetical protein n=1 Tax=Coleofasciculus sp. B1-GNL1-01 TaxID=3068484 RepID=UPI0033037E84
MSKIIHNGYINCCSLNICLSLTNQIPEQQLNLIPNCSVVFHWFHENRDPSAETVVQIAEALHSLNPDAAAEFIRLYVGDFLKSDEES